MRVCDYIAERLATYGVKYVYGLMGGGASGLNDGFIQNKAIEYICFHHEQGAGYAAVGESKITNKISVVNPTTGCGGGNCITPLVLLRCIPLPAKTKGLFADIIKSEISNTSDLTSGADFEYVLQSSGKSACWMSLGISSQTGPILPDKAWSIA